MQQPPVGQGFLIRRCHDRIQTHNTRYDSSGRGNSPKQRLLPDNTQHPKQQTSMPQRDSKPQPSKRAAADP
jgi:hypothetical protein